MAETAVSSSTDTIEAPGRDPEDGLRDLAPKDWAIGSLVALLTAGVLLVLVPAFVPETLRVPLVVLGLGMGLLGYLDQVTQLIRNRHTLIFGVFAAASLQFAFMESGSQSWIAAVFGGAGVMVFLLVLTVPTGFAGGGDIKLSPIPGAVLAVVSPLAPCLWMFFTLVLCLLAMIAVKLSGREVQHAAMAPFMAISLVPSLVVSGLAMQQVGLA